MFNQGKKLLNEGPRTGVKLVTSPALLQTPTHWGKKLNQTMTRAVRSTVIQEPITDHLDFCDFIVDSFQKHLND
jgi:hypothetical protein